MYINTSVLFVCFCVQDNIVVIVCIYMYVILL